VALFQDPGKAYLPWRAGRPMVNEGPGDPLLEDLRRAVRSAPGPVELIEVGTALSIALGRQRPAVSCGGCSDPLTFEGIPTRTVPGLRGPHPYRLVLSRTN
jgi:hypothetical protein